MKFQVGDKVRIKPIEWWKRLTQNDHNKSYNYSGCEFGELFVEKYAGTEQIVWRAYNVGLFCINIALDGNAENMVSLSPNMIDLVEEKTLSDAIGETLDTIFDELPNTAFNTQVGGNHYTKLAIQPMEYSMKNNMNALQHTIIKYITRYKDKNGLVS